MDHVTYDDDGNPIVGQPRRRMRNRPTLESVNLKPPAMPITNSTLTGIFEIEGATYDVVIDSSRLSWVPVNTSSKGSRTKKSKASIMKRLHGAKSLDSPHQPDRDSSHGISFRDLLGVRLKHLKRDPQKPGDGICQGVEVFAYDKKGANRYKDRALLLAHPSEDICAAFMSRIKNALAEYTERPTRAKIFLQPYAGKKQSRSIFETKVKPLFDTAGIISDVTEVAHNEHIKQQFVHMELGDFDCIVCVGGDGTVHKVLNGLLNKVQGDDEEMRPTQPVHRSPIPLGIIPTGLVNQIAHSLHGIEDVVSSAIHIILGHKKPVNVSALYHKDRLHRWAFNCHYGFFGNILPYLSRYNMLGDKRMEAAVMKGLTKKKFRSYEAEVKYIPASPDAGHVGTGDPCVTGCSLCDIDILNSSHLSSYSDDVQELDPLTNSSTSSTIIDLSKEAPYKSIKGDFIDVGVYSLPGLSSLATRGMSPRSHTNDGLLDLVLVRAAGRKEFVRYLRRLGNTKNQFDFPFVETFRCKEINFHIRLKETWKHTDYDFNEIDYEMGRRERVQPAQMERAQSMDVIEDLFMEESDSDEEDSSTRRGKTGSSTSTSSSNQRRGSDARAREVKRPTGRRKDRSKSLGGGGGGGSWMSITYNNEHNRALIDVNAVTTFQPDSDDEDDTDETSQATSRANSVIGMEDQKRDANSYIYRKTFAEVEHARRLKHQQKKDERRKAEAEATMKSVWNLDTEVCIDLDIDFRIHQNMLSVFAQGVSPDTEYDDTKYSCLTVMK